MKRIAILVLASLTLSAFAQQGAPPDVPRNHWAFPAVDELFRAGLLKGYPDGTFKGTRPMSRYEMAGLLARVNQNLKGRLDGIQAQLAQGAAAPGDRQALESQLADLRREIDGLRAMRADISSLTDRLAAMREQMAKIRSDLGDMRQRTDRIKG